MTTHLSKYIMHEKQGLDLRGEVFSTLVWINRLMKSLLDVTYLVHSSFYFVS